MSWNVFRGSSPDTVARSLRESSSISVGLVTKPYILSPRPYDDSPRPERGGLRCQALFGPVRPYRCGCSKYHGEEHKNTRCEKCGVEVLGVDARSRRWAHAQLQVPVLHPVCAPVLGERLGLEATQVLAIARGEAWLETSPERNFVHLFSQNDDEKLSQILDRLDDGSELGVGALRAALQDVPEMNEPAFVERVPVPPPSERPLIRSRRQWLPGRFDLAFEFLLARNERLGLIQQLSPRPKHEWVRECFRLQRAFEALIAVALSAEPQRASATALKPCQVEDEEEWEHTTTLLWTTPASLHLAKEGELITLPLDGGPKSRCAFSMRPMGQVRAWDASHLVIERCWYEDSSLPLAVFDRESGAWRDEWPVGLRAWTVDPLDEAWHVLHNRVDGTQVPVKAHGELQKSHDEIRDVVSSCGDYIWIGDNVYDVRSRTFGAMCTSMARRFEIAPSEFVVLRDGACVTLDEDGFEEASQDLSDLLAESSPALALRSDVGFLALCDGILFGESGPRLLLEVPYHSATFSPDGSHLALVTEDQLWILDTGDFALEIHELATF